jgi:hypothetical protein
MYAAPTYQIQFFKKGKLTPRSAPEYSGNLKQIFQPME